MPALPLVNAVKLEWNYGNEDALATNVLYFGYVGGPPSNADLETFASMVEAQLGGPYVGASVDTTAGISQKFTDLGSPSGAVFVGDYIWVGTLTGDVVSANNSVVVSHVINRRYRGGHPRTYMMVGSSTVLEGSSVKDWQSSFLVNIENGWNTFLGNFPYTVGGTSLTLSNVSYYETVGGVRVLRAVPLVDTVVGITVRARVCSQRRRLGKVGG